MQIILNDRGSSRLSVAPIIVAIGVFSSCDKELSKVLYSFTVLAFSSFCLDCFSIFLILLVSTALIIAITKYIRNRKPSSAESI